MRTHQLLIIAMIIALATWALAQPEHNHRGEQSEHTLKDVMQHLSSAEQQIQIGLLSNNRLMIAKGAKAIAHHPNPKGASSPISKEPCCA